MSDEIPDPFDSPLERRVVLGAVHARLFGPSDPSETELVAPTLGRFSVLRKLSQGGMGTVYLGYDESLGRKAAIKVLRGRREADTTPAANQARARMLREAKALARLSHPNVVPIYESGEHEDDLYIAMEFVEGQTLATRLETERDWETILALFIDAGRGLAAAHAAKLVHRDFKPDNVMIGGDGRVKVMDFGLARRASPSPGADDPNHSAREVSASIDLTQTGALMGTPAYMAPEQLVGGHTDARCDQFSFCVALWEALYGQRPFAGTTLGSLRKNVLLGRLVEPPRRSEVPARLRAILERGLRVEVDERWPTMDALLDALGDRPRRRWWTGIALGVTLLVVGSAGWAAARLSGDNERPVCVGMDRELRAVWTKARRSAIGEAISATGLSYAGETRSLVEGGLDTYAARWVEARERACEATARGTQSEARLDRRMACLDEALAQFDALLAVLERADASVVPEATRAIDGLPEIEACAKRSTSSEGPPLDPDRRARLDAISRDFALARAEFLAGRYEAAAKALDALAPRAETLGYAPLQIEVDMLRAKVSERRANYDQARERYVETYRMALAHEDSERAARAAIALVRMLGGTTSDNAEATSWVVHAEALSAAVASPAVEYRLVGALGLLETGLGNYDAALVQHRRQVELIDELGPHSGVDISDAYTNLGNTNLALTRYADAEPQLREALALRELKVGAHHPGIAGMLDNLGVALKGLGRYDEALEHYERSLAISEQTLGTEHPEVANSLSNLGLLQFTAGRSEQARTTQTRALTIYRQTLGPRDARVAIALSNLGMTLQDLGEGDAALAAYEEALEIKRERYGERHPSVIYTLNGIANLELGRRRLDAAEDYYGRALTMAESELGDHLVTAVALNGLSTVAEQRGNYRRALGFAERAFAIARQAFGPDNPQLAIAHASLGRIHLGLAQPELALPELERAVELRTIGLDPDANELLESRAQLGVALIWLGRPVEALAELESIVEHGADDELAMRELAGLVTALEGLAVALDASAQARLDTLQGTLRARPARSAAPSEAAEQRLSSFDTNLEAALAAQGARRPTPPKGE